MVPDRQQDGKTSNEIDAVRGIANHFFTDTRAHAILAMTDGYETGTSDGNGSHHKNWSKGGLVLLPCDIWHRQTPRKMPRFGLGDDNDDPDDRRGVFEALSTKNNCIRQLSCLSPDGRSVHSLSADYIETHSLPLEGSTDDEIVVRNMPVMVRTRLPQRVLTALTIESAVELVCVEADAIPTNPSPLKKLIPLLCLYTRKSVFMIQISHPLTTVGVAQGEILSVLEPFESILLQSSSIEIIRLRPAPQRYMGFACLCPRASMALLVKDTSVNEFRIILHHGNGRLTTPLEFSLEELGEVNSICDFCFGQSNELALLATISIYLLQQGGNVLAASPILFHGTVVSVAVARDALEYLDDLIVSEKRDAQFRRAKAAQYMLLQAFGNVSGKDDFDTISAQVGVGGANHATKWPVQIQGPVIISPYTEPDDECKAVAIENFFSMDLVGLVIARAGNRCDFCVTSPSALLPRTSYESIDNPWDTDILNEDLKDLGAVIERIEVDTLDANQPSTLTALLRDPSDATMIHLVSDSVVLTFVTNAMEIFSNKVRDTGGQPGFVSPSKKHRAPLKSTAFTSVAVTADLTVTLQGATVTNDAQLGHTLIARLSDGSMHAVNMTETKFRHESETIPVANTETKSTVIADPIDEALKAVEATQPLMDILKPVLEKIQYGLDDGLTKIVGAATEPKDIDPATLAVVLDIKNSCEKKVIVPLKELRRLSQSRMSELKLMMKAQISQLQVFKETYKNLKTRLEMTTAKLKEIEDNAKMLANRSNSLHQAGQVLQQTVSKAEQEYFDLLESLNSKMSVWEDSFATLRERSEALCDEAENDMLRNTVELDAHELRNCQDVNFGCEVVLKRCNDRVTSTSALIENMVEALGMSTHVHFEQNWEGQ